MRKYDLGKILKGTKKKRAITCRFTFIPSYGEDFDDKRLIESYKEQLLHGFRNTIEAIYQWDDDSGIIIYLQSLLNQFTKYMTDNNLNTNYKISFYDIFYGKIAMICEADTIEECYAKFKFMVDGYCRMWEDKEKLDVD